MPAQADGAPMVDGRIVCNGRVPSTFTMLRFCYASRSWRRKRVQDVEGREKISRRVRMEAQMWLAERLVSALSPFGRERALRSSEGSRLKCRLSRRVMVLGLSGSAVNVGCRCDETSYTTIISHCPRFASSERLRFSSGCQGIASPRWQITSAAVCP